MSIALRRYIKNKFSCPPKELVQDTEFFITVDRLLYSGGLFRNFGICFDLDTNLISGDLPVSNRDVDIAIDKLKYYFYIAEIHDHMGQQHIHIEADLKKENIDNLVEVLNES